MAKLWKEDILAIKRALRAGVSQRDVASAFSVSPATISRIASGRIHADVPYPGDPPANGRVTNTRGVR
jgi:predicted transcriptional regulator